MSTPAGGPGYPGDQQQTGVVPGGPAGGYGGAQTGYGEGGTAQQHDGLQQGGFQQGGGYAGGQGQGGPGVGERVSHAADNVARHVKTPETKEFFKTSEFAVWALTALGILISAAVISEGDGSDFPANQAWLYVAIVSFAYIVSRGIAKTGSERIALRRGRRRSS